MTAVVFFLTLISGAHAAVLFESDWSTTDGNPDTINDSGKWEIGGDGLSVIPSTGLDFPTANVLQVTALESVTGFAFLRKAELPIPAIGENRYYRWYARVPSSVSIAIEDVQTHPHQDGNDAASTNWMFLVWQNTGGVGKWTPQWWT